jgi:hypothetical protein
MFGWFRPTCPCDPAAKRWVEERLRWLTRQFGLHVLLERPIILPTPDFFPEPWDGTEEATRVMFGRVCDYMGVRPNAVELQIFVDDTPGSMRFLDPSLGMAAGTWSGGEPSGYSDDRLPWEKPEDRSRVPPWRKGVIRLEKSTLDRPSDLVGTMAHELSHQLLLGEGRISQTAFDNELLTDLTAVYHGFGVFLANNPRKSTGELSRWPGTQLFRPEYLSEPMFGYALAHLAWHRDEAWPAWAKHLRWTPRAVFKQGLRFLQKIGDSSFKPVRLRIADDSDEAEE